jgi:hypothetical protein
MTAGFTTGGKGGITAAQAGHGRLGTGSPFASTHVLTNGVEKNVAVLAKLGRADAVNRA